MRFLAKIHQYNETYTTPILRCIVILLANASTQRNYKFKVALQIGLAHLNAALSSCQDETIFRGA